MQFTEERLKEIILEGAKVKLPAESIVAETDLIADLGYDSISLIKLLSDTEKAFEIRFEDEELVVDVISKYGRLKESIMNKLSI